MSRSEIMDTGAASGGDLAVRLAIGETQVLQDNREFFLAHGVDVSAVESSTSASKAVKRSGTMLLIKNLPHDVVNAELEDMFAK
jgi:multiple RNA-binding domain-containing protein 1